MSEIEIYHVRILDLCTQSIPKRIGTYVVTHTPDNIHAEKYVGSTKNLYNRIYSHCDKEMIYIDLYITDDIDIAESLERILIELIIPATNIIIPSLSDNDNEVMSELLMNTNIKEHILNNVVKVGYRFLKYIDKNDKKFTEKPVKNEQVIMTEFERKICRNGDNKYMFIPREWGKLGDMVKVEIINENELKITKI